MKNILVFPCGSEIGLEIQRSVKFSPYFHLIGGSSVHDHGEYVYDDYIGDIPQVGEDNFITALQEIVRKHKIDAIYPAMDFVIAVLKHYEQELGCKVITSCYETAEICLSKRTTYEKLKGVVRVPNCYNRDAVSTYPIFAKPSIGYGAKGTKMLLSQDELLSFLADKSEEYLLLEYLPGKEYTIDCFTDRHGCLQFASARQRSRIRNGISVNTSFVDEQERFFCFAKKINESISFRGAWFVQVKETENGDLCLLEIAARFGGSSGLSRALGVNFAQLSLFDAFDYDVRVLQNDFNVIMDRALNCKYKCNLQYDMVFVDYDDCIVFKNKSLNVLLMAFLIQCRNNRKRIVLISRHEGNLEDELTNFRIKEIFDEIIHIDKSEKKSKYITSRSAIFIDDSYAERYDVKSNCGISVFSPDMIDTLIEGKWI